MPVTSPTIFRLGQKLDISLDELSYVSEVVGTYHQLDTSNSLLLGGAASDMLVQDLTRGHFTQVQILIIKCNIRAGKVLKF